MNEIYGDVFDIIKTGEFQAMCITTNGIVKKNGEAVMGAGIALECRTRWKDISLNLGSHIKQFGNHVHLLGNYSEVDVFSFPTKRHWYHISDITLIQKSCKELIKMLDLHNIDSVLLPRPGCNSGGLLWQYVKPAIERILDDRVYIVHYSKE